MNTTADIKKQFMYALTEEDFITDKSGQKNY